MQDRFVGDIGDFGKYGLLRHLCGVTGPKVDNPLRLGVVWYFNEDGPSGGDLVQYLSKRFAHAKYDPCLYKALKKLVSEEKRKVTEVQNANIIPVHKNDTYFIDNVLTGERRNKWFIRALKAMEDVELVFLDPDTGIKPKYPRNPEREYVRQNEIDDFIKENKSLIIYQHSSRNRKNDIARIKDFRKQIGRPVWAFTWASQYFLIIPAKPHEKSLGQRVEDFRQSLWVQEDSFAEV